MINIFLTSAALKLEQKVLIQGALAKCPSIVKRF